jgi:predicted amidophosphoribosyltransferase
MKHAADGSPLCVRCGDLRDDDLHVNCSACRARIRRWRGYVGTTHTCRRCGARGHYAKTCLQPAPARSNRP